MELTMHFWILNTLAVVMFVAVGVIVNRGVRK